MTRSNQKWLRIYVNGYDVSGFANSTGSFGFKVQADGGEAYADAVKNYILGQMEVLCGPINSFLAPVAAGSIGYHELLSGGNVIADVLLAMGTGALPAVGDPAFAYKFAQSEYTAKGQGIIGATVSFPGAANGGPTQYAPFGYLVHANGAETAVNAAIATLDNGVASAAGGVFCYQLLSSNGTVTLSVDDSATNLNNAAFAALSGATSGSIDASVTPKSGFVSLTTTATVRRCLRWQLAFGTATTATFLISFIRG